MPRRSLVALTVAALVGAPLTLAAPAHAADPVDITLVDINDFHGRIDSNTTKFATTIEQIRSSAGEANTLFLSVGDNIGASVFASATQQDQPTLDVLNALGLQASAAGNHEFDAGYADLTGRVMDEADFPYLGANVVKDGQSLQKSEILTAAGLKVAVIGAVTQETPSLVSPGGIAGVTFGDPVTAVNTEAARLEALPADEKPDLIVAAYHDGAGAGTAENATLEQEIAAGGAFAHLVNDTDSSVDAILTGHTHKTYAWDAPVPGGNGKTRPIIQTGSYGENIGKTVLKVDPDTGDVASYTVANVPRVTTANETLPRVAAVKAITDAALANAAVVGNVKVGEISKDVTTAYTGGTWTEGKYTGGTRDDRASESTIGNLVPDAMLAQSKTTRAPADLALNNPGGLRNELLYAGNTTTGGSANTDGVVTLAEANAVLPFANNLFTVTLTGASLKKVFEQQWQRLANGTVPARPYLQLGMSKNVRYTYDATRPEGDRITSIWVNDQQIDAAASYKVVVPSFLATGGDNFRAFTEGTGSDTTVVDYKGLIAYLGANTPVAPDFARRSVAVTGLAGSYTAGDDVTFSLPKLDLTSQGSPANTEVSATLEYGAGRTKSLGTNPVTNGASEAFSFTLPRAATPASVIRVTAKPSGTVATIPLTVAALPAATSTTTATAPEQVTKSDRFDVDVAVETSDSAPADGGTVTVKDGSTTVGTGTVADGTAKVEVSASALRLGKRTLTVEYEGETGLAGSQTMVKVEVIKGEITLTATGSTTPYGTPPVITFTSSPADTGVVYVVNPLGMQVGIAFLVDGKGTFTGPGDALAPGVHPLTLIFNGSASSEQATVTTSVTVTKAASAVKASVAKKVKVGKRTTLTARVSGVGYVPDGGTVTVKRGAKVVGTASVKKGVATVKLAKFTKRGKVTLTVAYSGSDVAEPSATTVRTTVVRK